jgi:hypothetical protein
MPMEPGQSLRECNAYEGSEVANRFVMIEPLWGWRTVNITGQHISCDIAGRVRLLADEDYCFVMLDFVLLQPDTDA